MSTTNTLHFSNSTTDQLKKPIDELLESVRLERRKYNEFAIIKEIALRSTTEDCGLPPDTQSKIRDAFMSAELDNLSLSSNNTVLGLESLTIPELTYEEKFQLRNVVQSGINNKCISLFHELDTLGITYNDKEQNHTLNLTKEDDVLLSFKNDLIEKQRSYVLKLEELITVLEELIQLKSERFPKVTNENIDVYEMKLKLYSLQSEVLNAKVKISIFTETNSSLDAYQELTKEILHQQSECKQQIEELENLKEKYQQVSCKQYNEILRKFLKYKTIVEKKKILYNKVHRNDV